MKRSAMRPLITRAMLAAWLTVLLMGANPVQAQEDPSRVKARTVELIAASDYNEPVELKRLLEAGYDPNGKFAGGTALHTAIVFGRVESVRLLLQHGADPMSSYDDDTVPGYAGLNALQLAEKLGRPEIIGMIRQAVGSKEAASVVAQDTATTGSPDEVVSLDKTAGLSAAISHLHSPLWEKPGRFKVGETVLYSRDRGKTWQRGTITKIVPLEGVPRLEGVPFYQIDDERKVTTDLIDTAFVTALDRQKYWTDFFYGDWNLHLPLVMTTQVQGDDLYRIYSGADRLPPLRVNSDATYSWSIDESRVIRGTWRVNESGPGLILLNGDRGDHWHLYSTSEASERETFKRDTVRLVSQSGNYTPLHGFRLGGK